MIVIGLIIIRAAPTTPQRVGSGGAVQGLALAYVPAAVAAPRPFLADEKVRAPSMRVQALHTVAAFQEGMQAAGAPRHCSVGHNVICV